MTQSKGMGRCLVVIGALAWGASACAQTDPPAAQDQNYRLYTERPRIFLRPQRLQRE